jgi:hypothetical protein
MKLLSQHPASRILQSIVVVAGLGLLSAPSFAGSVAAEPILPQQAAKVAVATDVHTHDGVVTGKIVNESNDTIRSVKLMVDHAWMWKDEWKPGNNDPSRTDFYVVHKEIPPRGSATFEYKTSPPLPHRNDGHFETLVKVAGFTQIGS